jgi:hypothetical protein
MKRNSQDALIRSLERRVLSGDLSAVRELARAYERAESGSKDPVADVLGQIDALKKAGLFGVDARRQIGISAKPTFTDEGAVNAARDEWHRDGAIEIDHDAAVSIGYLNGAYVEAWVWVDLDSETAQQIRDREASE